MNKTLGRFLCQVLAYPADVSQMEISSLAEVTYVGFHGEVSVEYDPQVANLSDRLNGNSSNFDRGFVQLGLHLG